MLSAEKHCQCAYPGAAGALRDEPKERVLWRRQRQPLAGGRVAVRMRGARGRIWNGVCHLIAGLQADPFDGREDITVRRAAEIGRIDMPNPTLEVENLLECQGQPFIANPGISAVFRSHVRLLTSTSRMRTWGRRSRISQRSTRKSIRRIAGLDRDLDAGDVRPLEPSQGSFFHDRLAVAEKKIADERMEVDHLLVGEALDGRNFVRACRFLPQPASVSACTCPRDGLAAAGLALPKDRA